LIACASLALLYIWPRSIDKRPTSFAIETPDKVTEIRTPAISPDGRMIVFSGVAEGKVALYLRALDALDVQRLTGTDDASLPFWSPDNRNIGFFSGNKLKKVDITGGLPQTLCTATEGLGGSWNRDGVILFGIGGKGLQRISAAGGEPTPVLPVDSSHNEIDHDYPLFLPDGKNFLYYSYKGNRGAAEIYMGSLQGDRKLLFRNDSNVAYVNGYLFFARGFTLMAQAFDASKLVLTGEPFTVMENVAFSANSSYSHFSIADNGTLVFSQGNDLGRQLVWFDRSGKQIATVGPPGTYNDIVLSPDGKRAAMQKIDGGNSDIWIMDLERGVPVRFTFGTSAEDNPSWSADGRFLVYSSSSEDKTTFFKKNSNGTGTEEAIYQPTGGIDDGTDLSPDGKYLLFEVVGQKTLSDVWLLPLDGSGNARPLFGSEFAEFHAHFSPDGRWVAYASSESGRPEIYVQSFPLAGGKWQVSTGGGAQPHWRRDGKELFFMAPDRKLMAVDVKLGSTFEMGTPAPLFQTQVSGSTSPNRYDTSANGQRFLVNSSVQESVRTPLVVILNWAAGIKK
jgi:Tol biopolymer transport system component